MIIVDVREKEEFEAEHVPESISLPLSQFDLLAPGLLKTLKGNEVSIMCRTGNRAKMALTEFKKLDSQLNGFTCYEGGIVQWKKEGKDVNGKKSIFPLMRQVQIVASTMIFLAFLGFHFIAPGFIYLALFVGGGLALAGYTGFCPMALILQHMPWNNKKTKECSAESKSCCG